jgi:hypothetical protein
MSINLSVKINDFGVLEIHQELMMSGNEPQDVEKRQLQYAFPTATAPTDPAIVYPVVAFS